MKHSDSGPTYPPGYMPQLDALRAIAVAMVAAHHWFPATHRLGFNLGATGVQLFFVISGMLITSILLRCRENEDIWFSIRSFFARRCLRIFPLYYLAIAVVCLLNFQSARDTVLWNAFYLSNIYMFWNQQWNGNLSHFWSLAVEEQFYLFWPWLICFIPKRSLLPVVLSLVAIGIATPYLAHLAFPGITHVPVLTISCFDAIGLGGIIALAKTGNNIAESISEWSIIGFPLILLLKNLSEFGWQVPSVHYFAEQTAILLCLVWVVQKTSRGFTGVIGALLENKTLIFLGRISYGLYLIHSFAPSICYRLTSELGLPFLSHGLIGVLVRVLITVCLAVMSWLLFESPINAFKSKFPYERSKRL